MQPVLHVPAFEDNYIWLIRGVSTTHAALVDPGDAAPLFEALPRLGLTPAAILCTHHHGDHTGGIDALTRAWSGLPVYGPGNENIGGLTHPLVGDETVRLPELGLQFQVLSIPGHTRGHVAYYGHGWLFCGDTLFSAGCGRLFEGTAVQMHQSLSRLAALPGETLVYCAHEYTLANLRFAEAVEPDNPAIAAWRQEATALLANRQPTLPTTVSRELDLNPFLRASRPSVRAAAEKYTGQTLGDATSVFVAVRQWKDRFR
jgi:hydroxyacylglutathione hydrolase